jgi:DNA-binding HxlR family transcriptional regulator
MGELGDIRKRVLQSRWAVELLKDKWRIPVLHVLSSGPVRTGTIQRAMADVSPKVLTQTLRGMEHDGLIERSIRNVVPAHVEYSLTGLGSSLLLPLHGLCRWALEHTSDIEASRGRCRLPPSEGSKLSSKSGHDHHGKSRRPSG